jgi:hypothetical protein
LAQRIFALYWNTFCCQHNIYNLKLGVRHWEQYILLYKRPIDVCDFASNTALTKINRPHRKSTVLIRVDTKFLVKKLLSYFAKFAFYFAKFRRNFATDFHEIELKISQNFAK